MNVSRRPIVSHGIGLCFVVIATGVAILAGNSELAVLTTFLAAVALAAWFGREEVGLAATGYSVIVLSIWFRDTVDVESLTAFAATGAVLSTFVRAARRVPGPVAAPEAEAQRRQLLQPGAPLAVALQLLVLVVYTGVSDALMRVYSIPSLLQPVIALLIVVVWRHRRELAPGAATLHIVVFLLGGYALVMFATTVWATDAPLADARISEVVKALVICLLVASLSPSWKSLRRAMATLVVAAAAMSSLSIVQVATGHFIDIVGGLVAARMANIYGHTMGLRATGPPVLHDPNFYARILLIALPLGVVLALVQEKRARRIAYFAASAAIAGGILVTYSRGAMLALGMVIALLLLAMRVRARTLVAGAVGVVLLLPLMPGAVGKRLTTLTSLVPGDEDPAGEADESVQVRTLYGLSAVKMFEANPFAGVGAGNFGRHYDEYANVVGSTVYDYAPPGEDRYPHSLYLQIASETGLLGLAAFFATAAAAFHSLWRSRKRLLERGEEAHALLAVGLAISLFAYLVASAVLHESYLRYVAMVFGFVCAIARLTGTCAAEETDGDGVPASQQPALQPA